MRPEFTVIPQTDMSFIGLRRSGNHAVIDWVLGHCHHFTHYNNCIATKEHSETTERTDGFAEPFDGSVGDAESPFTLASYEDYDLGWVEDSHVSEPRILLLRDPFNLFASRLRKVRQFIEDEYATFSCFDMISDRGFEMWKRYARAFLGSDKYIKIDFNHWYTSVDYRKDTASRLGFTFNDRNFGSEEGWRHSGGSSFGGKPDPLNSHKHMEHDEEYLSFFDEEIFELSHKLGFSVPNFRWDRPKGYYEQIFCIMDEINNVDEYHQDEMVDVLKQAIKCFPKSSLLRQKLAFLERINLMQHVIK